jgi:hypothetical protein
MVNVVMVPLVSRTEPGVHVIRAVIVTGHLSGVIDAHRRICFAGGEAIGGIDAGGAPDEAVERVRLVRVDACDLAE